jgi:hypothetical protein
MFGERYFAMRERIVDVMASVRALAEETHTDLGEGLDWQEIEKGLSAPFLFVVCGEVNAGKSTLLNGLFGRPICRASVLPETDRVMWYGYGDPARDEDVMPLLRECYRPVDSLRDFNLVDTPGTNSAVRGHQGITERFLPVADLILFVFPVSNPWGAASWDYLSRLPPGSLDRAVFVLQQADTRDPADLDVIRGHVRDLSLKRIGRVMPVFAVSGRLALESKQPGAFAPEKWRASGYAGLEDFISRNVCDTPERRRALELWRQKAAAMLRKIEDRIEEQTRALARDGRFLDGLEREIDELRGRFVVRLTRHLAEVAEIFQTEASWVARMLHKRLASWRSIGRLFTGDKTLAGIEALFVERMEQAVGVVASRDGAEILHVCAAHWESLRPRVREAIQTEMPEGSVITEMLGSTRLCFEKRIVRSARQGIDQLNVRGVLDRDLRRRNGMLMVFTALGLIFVTAAGICGSLFRHWWWIPWGLMAFAVMAFAAGMILGMASRREIVRDFRQRLLDACGGFATTLRGDYEEGLRVVFKDYAGGLQLVRKHLADEKLELEPRSRKWTGLFLVLKAIEQEL